MGVGAGTKAGFAQGELLGMLANLKTMAAVLSPLLWSRIYAFGVRRYGASGPAAAGWFHCAVMVLTLGRMALAHTLRGEFNKLS